MVCMCLSKFMCWKLNPQCIYEPRNTKDCQQTTTCQGRGGAFEQAPVNGLMLLSQQWVTDKKMNLSPSPLFHSLPYHLGMVQQKALCLGLPSLCNHEPNNFLLIINYPVSGILLIALENKPRHISSYVILMFANQTRWLSLLRPNWLCLLGFFRSGLPFNLL
jgi:hypothetical protein